MLFFRRAATEKAFSLVSTPCSEEDLWNVITPLVMLFGSLVWPDERRRAPNEPEREGIIRVMQKYVGREGLSDTLLPNQRGLHS